MARLKWDQVGQRLFETGTSNGVLFATLPTGEYDAGVAWNGLVAVRQTPSGAEPTAIYADNLKYLELMSAEEFGGTIEAYTYPDKFMLCDGSAEVVPGANVSQQTRRTFGLAYKTLIGNDVLGDAYGYKIHVIYNARVSPSERSYETVNETPNAITFSWEFTTTAVPFEGEDYKTLRPTSHLVFDSTKLGAVVMAAIEDTLFGAAAEDASLPSPDELLAIAGGGAEG